MYEQLFFALWIGFLAVAYGFVGALLFWKAIQGDITFREAAVTWGPLAFSYLGVFAGGGSVVSWVSGFGGLGYLCWVTFRRHHEEKRTEEDLVNRELVKWSRAIADDDANAGAHLFFANALVERRDFDTAALHYRRSLELDPTNVRELERFLGRRTVSEGAEIRSRLPELGRIAQEQRERDAYGRVVSGANPQPAAPLVAEDADESREPPAPAAEGPKETPPERQYFGYDSEEERFGDQERSARLAEMRRVLDASPDDVVTRFAYGAALEDAGYPERAGEEYRHVLALRPGHAEARRALARLDAEGPKREAPSGGGTPGPRRSAHLALLKEVLRAGDREIGPRLAYARALEEDGLREDALEQYQRVAAQAPGNREAAAALARLGKAPASPPAVSPGVEIPAAPSQPRQRA